MYFNHAVKALWVKTLSMPKGVQLDGPKKAHFDVDPFWSLGLGMGGKQFFHVFIPTKYGNFSQVMTISYTTLPEKGPKQAKNRIN